jgi:hypothetical protein
MAISDVVIAPTLTLLVSFRLASFGFVSVVAFDDDLFFLSQAPAPRAQPRRRQRHRSLLVGLLRLNPLDRHHHMTRREHLRTHIRRPAILPPLMPPNPSTPTV